MPAADVTGSKAPCRDYLLDVSRLIWRYWAGRLPTGIDRVCLAYVEHFGPRAQAVVQRGGRRMILSARHSERLFALLLAPGPPSRAALAALLVPAFVQRRRGSLPHGRVYLNLGHTGLDDPGLPRWIARHRLRAIYMVHDLIPLSHPQFCRAGEADRHKRRMDNVLASAAGVIGNSQATLDELAAYARSARRSLPPTVAAWLSGPPAAAEERASPVAQPYFVMLGTIEGRKNHAMILRLWAELVAERGVEAPMLAVVGQRGWEAEAALALLDRRADFAGRLLHLERCDDVETAAFLNGAAALLMPSFAEGFGLPLIEALACGTPAIVSDLPVFHEIAGTVPTFLDPHDATAWKATIEAFCVNGPERRRQLAQMPSYRAPTWADHFRIVEQWLERL